MSAYTLTKINSLFNNFVIFVASAFEFFFT